MLRGRTALLMIVVLCSLSIGVSADPSTDKPGKPGDGGSAKAPRYSITEIEVPWEAECAIEATRDVHARRPNEKGDVVGYTNCYLATGDTAAPFVGRGMRGFLWRPEFGGQILPPLTGTSANTVFPREVNEVGTIVGFETSTSGSSRYPVRWTFSGDVSQAFDVFPCGSSTQMYAAARGINDSGDIIGEERTPDPASGACRSSWLLVTSDGQRVSGPVGYPVAINDNGVGVGYENVRSPSLTTRRTIKWSPDAGVVVLGTDNDSYDENYVSYVPYYLNNLGDVAGSRQEGLDESGCVTHESPIVFLNEGPEVVLPTLSNAPRGAAYGINDSGAIVGWTYAAQCGVQWYSVRRGVLWLDGIVFDLNDLIPKKSGIELTTAFSINNAGQIFAHGTIDAESEKPCPYWDYSPTGEDIYVERMCKPRHVFLLDPMSKKGK